MSVGERILTLRKEQNMSQGQLAQSLGVSRQAVSKWENDQTSPDTANLIKLAEVLNTEVAFLATGSKPEYLPAPVVVNLIEKEEKVIEKPVIKRVVRIRYRQNPVVLAFTGILCFLLGLLVGKIL